MSHTIKSFAIEEMSADDNVILIDVLMEERGFEGRRNRSRAHYGKTWTRDDGLQVETYVYGEFSKVPMLWVRVKNDRRQTIGVAHPTSYNDLESWVTETVN